MTDGRATGAGLIEFLDYLAEKGLANKSTMQARKSAVNKVLGIDDDWKDVDLRTLDLDQQTARFERLNAGGNYTPTSLGTYSSRFRSAVSDYLAYLDDPAGFRPAPTASRKVKRKARSTDADTNPESPSRRSTEEELTGGSAGSTPPLHRDNLVTYPYPLRQQTDAYLQLPRDLRPNEADRLAKFIASLAMTFDEDEKP